jgi:hypothetical protein
MPYDGHYLKMLAAVAGFGAAQAAEPLLPASTVASKTANPPPATVSEAVSAKLPRDVLPTFQPVKPLTQPGVSGGDDQMDEIYYLPDIKVTTAKRLPVSNFLFLNLKGRLELALKSNPGLGIGPLPSLNNVVALEMQKEEREDGKRSAMTEQVLSIAVGEDTSAKELIRLMRAATARPNIDWQTKSPR